MQINKIAGVMALTTWLFTGMAVPVMADEATAESAQQAIDAAEAARKKADAAGGEWRDTSKILDQAREALKAGDPAAAMAKAKKAEKQAELGYAQAESQKSPDSSVYFK